MIKCPEEWEIYSSMPGSKKANADITKAVQWVASQIKEQSECGYDVGPKMVMRLVKQKVRPIFEKHQKFGTFDTEPRAHVANYLAKVAEAEGADGEKIYEEIRWGI